MGPASALNYAAQHGSVVTIVPADFYDEPVPFTGTVREIPAIPSVYEIRPLGHGHIHRVMADDVAEVIFE
ncbi:hypothetical protein SEA_BAILEYBLU_49 [Arthrobacter phage BaileyBlu]|uniref:Uncharacterized protein n=1 Tax=Arthrobacter phage BaileyBlu TaxID=2910754 RepID=A0AA49BPT4_9CAUD|nr:RNA binding protein [Arthrobacter phage BaileyBlu]UJQ87187.1 hypothetical protein SEA_BAILEYBLU_49 [Arthrobacter phage BaileyBlu]